MVGRLRKFFNVNRLKRPKMFNIYRGGQCKFPV